MIEVEVKSKIKDFNSIERLLSKINAIKSHSEHQEDIYFNSPIKDFAKTDEALRIRKISADNYQKIFITYKGPKIDDKSKTREEIEVGVDDSIKVTNIFEKLGFKKVANVTKDRIIYNLDQYIISLDDVKGLGPYMEIETDIEEGNDFQEELNKIFEILKQLGITDGFERTSYLELLESKT